MDSSQRKSPSIFAALRSPTQASRKAAKSPRVNCEALEGRQLLTGGAPAAVAIAAPATFGPVEILPGSGVSDAILAEANSGLLRADLVPLSGASIGQGGADVTTMTAYDPVEGAAKAASSGLAHPSIPVAASTDVVTATTLAAPIRPISSGQISSVPGDFLATRGGVAMDASSAPVLLMARPGADAAQGDGELAKALRKLGADQAAVDAKSQVTPAMLEAVRVDLKAIEAARTAEPDASAVEALRASTEALQLAEIPTDELLARVQADSAAVFRSEGVPQGLIDRLHADQATIKAATNVTAVDLQLLASDRAAVQAQHDVSIQYFRGATTLEAPSHDVAATGGVTTLADIAALPEPTLPLLDVPADSIPVDDSQMATTSLTPTDVKVIMAPSPSNSGIKFKGEGQGKKQVKGQVIKARGGKALRLRFQNAVRRGGFLKMS